MCVHLRHLPFRQLDVRLLEKMKLNCQVFKEEISVVHLNRQAAHLQNALRESSVEVLFIKLRLLTPQVLFAPLQNLTNKLKVWSSVSSLINSM